MNHLRAASATIDPNPGIVRRAADGLGDESTAHDQSLVWIDTRRAVVLTWEGERLNTLRLTSDVPPHRTSSGHIRHDPSVRHGGGSDQSAGEARRTEHLRRFVEQVAGTIPVTHPVVVIGPGETREQLQHVLVQSDIDHGRLREVDCRSAGRLTEPQLVARLRELAGAPAPRATAGSWPWHPDRAAYGRRPSRQAVLEDVRRADDQAASEAIAEALADESVS
jgi:hypothetical protein